MGFAQQVGEREAEVEGRIAKVNDFVIEQDEALVVDQNVLRAVIAVHERQAQGKGIFDEMVEEEGCFGDLLGCVAIVWLDTEGDEEGAVIEHRCKLFALKIAVSVNCAEQVPELLDMALF